MRAWRHAKSLVSTRLPFEAVQRPEVEIARLLGNVLRRPTRRAAVYGWKPSRSAVAAR